MSRRAILFVVSGPSGSGKTTLVQHLLEKLPDTRFSVSYTTRAPRAGEQDGCEYHFVNRAEFEAMIACGEFIEYARVFDDYYGTHRSYLERAEKQGKDLLLDIDVQGAAQIRATALDGVFIFILPPSWDELKHRLRARGLDAAPVIERRLEFARREIAQIGAYGYIVINAEREQVCAEVEAIARAERARRRGERANPDAEAIAARCRPDTQRARVSAILDSFGVKTA